MFSSCRVRTCTMSPTLTTMWYICASCSSTSSVVWPSWRADSYARHWASPSTELTGHVCLLSQKHCTACRQLTTVLLRRWMRYSVGSMWRWSQSATSMVTPWSVRHQLMVFHPSQLRHRLLLSVSSHMPLFLSVDICYRFCAWKHIHSNVHVCL